MNKESKIIDVEPEGVFNSYSLAFTDVKYIKNDVGVLFKDSIGSFVIGNFESSGELSWLNNYEQSSIDRSNFDMIYGGDTLFVGMTTLLDFDLGNQKIKNLGNSDILTCKLVDGNIIDFKSFGSVDEEDVTDVTIMDGVFHFAGTFSGDTPQREIGAIKVVDVLPQFSASKKVYISYIEELSPQANYKNKTISVNKTTSNLTVAPNPFSDSFVVNIDSETEQQYVLEVFDVLGVRVLYKPMVELGGEANCFIDFPMGSGVYVLQVQDLQGNSYTQKIVKH